MNLRTCLAARLCQVAEILDPEHVKKAEPLPVPTFDDEWSMAAHRVAEHAIRHNHPKLLAPDRVAATVVVAFEQTGYLSAPQDAER